MSDRQDVTIIKNISWASIIAGVACALSVLLLLLILGSSFGLANIFPLSSVGDGSGTSVLLFFGVSIAVSLAIGGFTAGYVAKNNGLAHGFLVWSSSFILAAILSCLLLGSALTAAGNVIGTVSSATTSLVSGAGSVIGQSVSNASEQVGKVFERLDIKSNIENQDVRKNVIEALEKSGIPSLQPNFIQSQVEGAKNDVAHSVRLFLNNPDDADAIVRGLMDELKNRGQLLTEDINVDSVKKALQDNTDLTATEVDNTVNLVIEQKDKVEELLLQASNQLEEKINQARQDYEALKERAEQKAAEAAKAAAHAALWLFFALLIGAIVSAIAGRIGVKLAERHR